MMRPATAIRRGALSTGMFEMPFTCPRCGAVSHHPKDEEHGYCGRCHQFVEDMVNAVARTIFDIGKEARDRGCLSLWTVYDHPKDHPGGFIARRFETGGGTPEPVATDHVITGELALIRQSMERCGLYCMQRDSSDPANVVETWL
jgi:hypothetical protein